MINIETLRINCKKYEYKQNICKHTIGLYELYENLNLRFKGVKNRRIHISYSQVITLPKRHLRQMLWYFDLYHDE